MDDGFKIYSRDNGANFELYRILEDVAESNDLANKNPEKLNEMVAEWRKWKASVENSAEDKDY